MHSIVLCRWVLPLLVALLVGAAESAAALPVLLSNELDILETPTYTFDRFLDDFHKSYPSQEEYHHRRTIFEENLKTIAKHNSAKVKQQLFSKLSTKGGGGHILGINQFADQRPGELPTGYDKSRSRMSISRTSTTQRMLLFNQETLIDSAPFSIDPVDTLPPSVDWSKHGTSVKAQGKCGSCWAFSATAALETHIALRTGTLYELSPQELVSCATNPLHCGGEGGCTGSTAEIGYEHVRKHGIVTEWSFGYQSYQGDTVRCSLETSSPSSVLRGGSGGGGNLQNESTGLYREAVASVSGYVTLERNNYDALMNVIAKLGPAVVSVACGPWHLYKGGVFYAPLNTTDATNVNHAVVLEGYGTDQETGEDYWLVRNSWGPLWGEAGYIRLKRVDPSTLDDPESDCGVDVTPDDGDACTKDKDGNDIKPPVEKICGTSGILFDSSIPLGGHLV